MSTSKIMALLALVAVFIAAIFHVSGANGVAEFWLFVVSIALLALALLL